MAAEPSGRLHGRATQLADGLGHGKSDYKVGNVQCFSLCLPVPRLLQFPNTQQPFQNAMLLPKKFWILKPIPSNLYDPPA